MTARLRGMTWRHPRGHDPMVAAAAEWQRMTGIAIDWDQRPLQDFESYPVDELARRYDLIVIDHPHVGQVVAEDCLEPLDRPDRATEIAALSARSVGRSFESYRIGERLWALPIDAAAQVQAYVPQRLSGPCTDWREVLALAEAGRVALPLRPPHVLMCVFTLAAHLGSPCASAGRLLIDDATAETVHGLLSSLFRHLPADSVTKDPIAVFEEMAAPGSTIACAPLIYGYVSYAVDGFRPRLIAFADMPSVAGRPPLGSALGGTGIAVSARSAAIEAATEFAVWVASGPVQAGLYAAAGGQSGHADAWEDDAVNRRTHGFYRSTRATLEGAWVRPRHDGYMGFQHEAAEHIVDCLVGGRDARAFAAGLNALYARSFKD